LRRIEAEASDERQRQQAEQSRGIHKISRAIELKILIKNNLLAI
jgi:hypothetical protein